MAVSSACATGSHAVGEALKTIARDDADVVLAGGTEASILPVIFAGFINMRALSARNDEPKRASRPFDAERDGFVISEGAAVLVLEEAAHAAQRGARVYCEIVGYGSGNDAFHMVQPRDQGAGAAKVMRAALDAQRSHEQQLRPRRAQRHGHLPAIRAVSRVMSLAPPTTPSLVRARADISHTLSAFRPSAADSPDRGAARI